MTEHDLSAWLDSIAELFEDAGVEWTLIGALAANRYRATPRFTTDVDTLAQFDPSAAIAAPSRSTSWCRLWSTR